MKKTTINTILMAIIALMSISICFLIFCIATRPRYVTVNEPDNVIITEETAANINDEMESANDNNTLEAIDQNQNQTDTMSGKTSSRVNIRNGPSTDAKVLVTVDEGTVFDIIEIQDNGWTKILYEGTEAYISSDYVIVISKNE